ncbi:methylated-DNA--[protein]-cysteine S-methyltransferase [Marinobacter salinexigens]|uniref:methylated-DNA--[protein]-cysteine S-methyltransferase n=1 Tax=Marinobacter salinexigens TaxID=2919747 RepID=A0A5B0VLQ4_9GAMM|nr:methylated-DNA--[protein]-cysteine S-methyltransferase [Marinobacter salinexigens]KAA1174919.1 methylated-DNA--[protein]-cysteine S-methyltransferase [Marinobacter salinexigens]
MSAQHVGSGEIITWQVGNCYLGSVLVAHSDHGVCAVLPGDSTEGLLADLAGRFPGAQLQHSETSSEDWFSEVMDYLVDSRHTLGVDLDLRGTEFQRRVWQTLRTIPSGSRASYAEVARKVGVPSGSRAVAGACAANHLAVLVPCHRVVRSDGSLSGYRWGESRKRALLNHEQALSDR